MAAAELSGLLAEEIARRHPRLRVHGEAELLRPLPEPGCGRVVLRLHARAGAERIEFGEAELDLCEGGLPPGPPPGRP